MSRFGSITGGHGDTAMSKLHSTGRDGYITSISVMGIWDQGQETEAEATGRLEYRGLSRLVTVQPREALGGRRVC